VDRRILSLLLSVTLSSCSSLLYHPDSVRYLEKEHISPQPEDLNFLSHDGKNLHAWLFKNSAQKKAKAVVVFFHGNAQNLRTHFSSIFWILKSGYDFVIFDYQGYGESQGKATPQNTVKDGVVTLKYVKSLYPNTPLVVFGQSLGTVVASRVVFESHAEIPIKLMILDSAFSSYQNAGQDVLSRTWLTWPFQWLPYLLLSDKWASHSKIKDFPNVPAVFIHGTKDQVIEFSRGKKFYEKYPAAKLFIEVEKARHIESLHRSEKLRTKIIEILDNPNVIQGSAILKY